MSSVPRLTRQTHAQEASPAAKPPEEDTGAPKREASLIVTMVRLWPYLWPSDRFDLKLRVLASLALTVISKLVTIAVPFTFKWTTDALAGAAKGVSVPHALLGIALGGPLALTLLYGVARPDGGLDPNARGLFAQRRHACGAPARAAHLRAHAPLVAALPSRAQDRRPHPRARARPQRASRTIVRLTMMTVIPTVVEFALDLGVLCCHFDWRYVGS